MEDNSSFFRTWGKWVAGPVTKWITLAAWIVLVAVLSVVAPGVAGQENNSAALLPSSSASVVAQAKLEQAFPQNSGTPALLVWYRKGGLTSGDLQTIQSAAKYLANHPVPAEKSVTPVYKLPPTALGSFTSKDGTTFVLPVSFQKNASGTTLQSSLKRVQSEVQKSAGAVDSHLFGSLSTHTNGLHARITGPAGIAADAQGLFAHADITLLAATTLLVLALLIALYRSPLLALVPLINVGFAYGLVSPLLGILAKTEIITVDAQGVSIMTVLLFGAGTDYCLFLVARYRERLHEVTDKHIAIRDAVGGAAGAIAMSGLTVVLSLFTLLLAKYGSYHRFAVPFSLAVFIMALAGITLLPALLAILGRVSFFPFIPRTEQMWKQRLERRSKTVRERRTRRRSGEPGPLSRWIGHIVSTKPWITVAAAVVVLAVLAGFSLQIKTTYNLLASFPKDMPSRQGYTLLADHFPSGTLAPVDVLVNTKQPVDKVASSIKKLPFVASVSGPTASQKNASMQRLQVALNTDPYSNQAMSDIPKLRTSVVKTLAAEGVASPASHVYIAGQTATQLDTKQLTGHDTRVVIPVVIGCIALLLLLYLRSIVAMVYLVLTVLLSYFSALGLGWVVLHDVMGASAIQGTIPLYAFVFLVALGEDYNIFMVSRVWQEARSHPMRKAISNGVSRTSSVITSAGLILAGTFAVLSSLPIQILVQFGIVTAIGVLLDTFVVRPLVVPAITAILGRRAFWPAKPAPVSVEETIR